MIEIYMYKLYWPAVLAEFFTTNEIRYDLRIKNVARSVASLGERGSLDLLQSVSE